MESNQTLGNESVSTSATVPTSVSEQNTAPQNSEKKKGKGLIYGMILLAIFAVGGIGFGVWVMMDESSQLDSKDKQISDLKNQISELSNTIAEYKKENDEQVGNELNGDVALKLLQEASSGQHLGYGVANANVYSKCVDEDKEYYYVRFSTSHRIREGIIEYGSVKFEKDDNNWKFELPMGDTTSFPDDQATNCVVL